VKWRFRITVRWWKNFSTRLGEASMRNAELRIAGSYEDTDIEKICRRFEEKLGKKLEFKIIQDAVLIGGFLAYIDGKAYDMSVRARLKAVRRDLDE
jgi:F0F1-type ATP synthase delta subunit